MLEFTPAAFYGDCCLCDSTFLLLLIYENNKKNSLVREAFLHLVIVLGLSPTSAVKTMHHQSSAVETFL